MVYGTYNELVTGAYKPTYNYGAPHCGERSLQAGWKRWIEQMWNEGDWR